MHKSRIENNNRVKYIGEYKKGPFKLWMDRADMARMKNGHALGSFRLMSTHEVA